MCIRDRWRAIFNTDGLINTVITLFGGEKINWMAGANSALFVIILLRVWQFGSAMVIFLAALKGVSQDLYEAASIDGAGKWRQFFSITVPIITPVIFYNLITQLCQAFQEFNGPYLVTKGGPNGATTLISMPVSYTHLALQGAWWQAAWNSMRVCTNRRLRRPAGSFR